MCCLLALLDLDETLTNLDTELMELVEASEHYASMPRSRSKAMARSQSFRQPPVSPRPQSLLQGAVWLCDDLCVKVCVFGKSISGYIGE